MNGRTILNIVLGALIVLVLGGIGIGIYNAGVSQGIAQAATLPEGTAVVAPVGYGYGYGHPGFFGFGFLWILFPIFFLFLLFGSPGPRSAVAGAGAGAGAPVATARMATDRMAGRRSVSAGWPNTTSGSTTSRAVVTPGARVRRTRPDRRIASIYGGRPDRGGRLRTAGTSTMARVKTVLVVDDEPGSCSSHATTSSTPASPSSPPATAPSAVACVPHAPARTSSSSTSACPGSTASMSPATIRAESRRPIVMLTARDDELDKLLGLELGADDYVTKPFSPRELVARVRAVLRRSERAADATRRSTVGDLQLDVPRMRAEVAGAPADLTPTEFTLLATMARQPGRIFTRSQLLDAVHGVAFESYERAIDTHVKNLRRKIEPNPREPRYVLTVYGVGYRVADPAP